MTSKVRDFLDRAGMENLDSADPLHFALEAALGAVPGALDPEHAGRRAMRSMPASFTKFERGIAFGLAVALSAMGSR